MNVLLLIILICLLSNIKGSYNPIPDGCVIISTTRAISVMQPKEYGGTDKSTIIFTATMNMTIVTTIFDSTSRDLYIVYSNTTNNIISICQLISIEKLDPFVYQLPISLNTSDINKLSSFSSDVHNKRVFFTDQTGIVTMFSMSGAMERIISTPSTIINPIRSVGYNQVLNRLFIITDSTVDSCTGLDKNHLQCCQALPKSSQLRSINFDPTSIHSFAYVIDEISGIYQVALDGIGCPTAIRPFNTVGAYYNKHFIIYQDLYFCSGSNNNSIHNSILIIGNNTETSRAIAFDAPIVALHIAYTKVKSTIENTETCFHGIKYHDYRVAVILAAIFGTIMGIFMCFNALFCIDFFMTKRIIRDLKQQIPHNLLEDRWNRLVEEKYAKLALEIHRKRNDPPSKRKSSAASRKPVTVINENDNNQPKSGGDGETAQVSNPFPKITGYLRRKSESYLNRRRSDDNRNQRQINKTRISPENNPITTTEMKEEDNNPQKDLLKNEGELL